MKWVRFAGALSQEVTGVQESKIVKCFIREGISPQRCDARRPESLRRFPLHGIEQSGSALALQTREPLLESLLFLAVGGELRSCPGDSRDAVRLGRSALARQRDEARALAARSELLAARRPRTLRGCRRASSPTAARRARDRPRAWPGARVTGGRRARFLRELRRNRPLVEDARARGFATAFADSGHAEQLERVLAMRSGSPSTASTRLASPARPRRSIWL